MSPASKVAVFMLLAVFCAQEGLCKPHTEAEKTGLGTAVSDKDGVNYGGKTYDAKDADGKDYGAKDYTAKFYGVKNNDSIDEYHDFKYKGQAPLYVYYVKPESKS